MRIVVCDDDPLVRDAIRVAVESEGHSVLAETDQGFHVVQLVQHFHPDAVVLDLVLPAGSGRDVVAELLSAGRHRCHIVIFSAFSGGLTTDSPWVTVVEKPDFDRLRDLLGRLTEQAERRQHQGPREVVRTTSPMTTDDLPREFYAALDAAQPGDALLVVRPATAHVIDPLAVEVRQLIRTEDWLLKQSTRLVVLLIGGEEGTGSVATRVSSALSDYARIETAYTVLVEGEAPNDAFFRMIAAE